MQLVFYHFVNAHLYPSHITKTLHLNATGLITIAVFVCLLNEVLRDPN